MADYDINEVCDDIATTLGVATGIVHAQSYDELTEGVPDVPLLQVYPESGETDVLGNTDRLTFQAAKRTTEYVFNVDVLCRARSNMGQDMKAVVDQFKAVEAVLEAQDTKPYFGNTGIKSFRWSWQRATFQPEGSDRQYVGFRVQITVRQF